MILAEKAGLFKLALKRVTDVGVVVVVVVIVDFIAVALVIEFEMVLLLFDVYFSFYYELSNITCNA